jgi:hypothetical protein
MKRNLLFIIALAAMYVSVIAQPYPTPVEITITGTNRAIEVDGYPDEDLWNDIIPLTYDFSFQDPAPEESDLSGSLMISWSELGLLVFLDVNDDVQNYWHDGENTWMQDNCEFFVYFGEEGTWGPDAEVSAVASDSCFSQIRIQLTDEYETHVDGRYLGEWVAPPAGPADSGMLETVAIPTGFGWSVEAIMPWTLFPKKFYEPAVGMKFGIEGTLADADETQRDMQRALTNDSGQDLAYDDKKYLATGILGNITSFSNITDNFVSTVSVYPTVVDNELNLKGDVNSLTIYDVTGQTVLSFKDNNITTVDVSALQPGIYFVNLNNNTTQKIIVR